MKTLNVSQCPLHRGFYAVSVDDPDAGCGTRVTPSKCCGRWDTLRAFRMSARDWRELAELATAAADEAEQTPATVAPSPTPEAP